MKDETYWLMQKEKHLANVEKERREEVSAKERAALLKEQYAALVVKQKKHAAFGDVDFP